jgi:hypothetical protein
MTSPALECGSQGGFKIGWLCQDLQELKVSYNIHTYIYVGSMYIVDVYWTKSKFYLFSNYVPRSACSLTILGNIYGDEVCPMKQLATS